MASVEITKEATEQLKAISEDIVSRMIEFLRYKVAQSNTPRHLATPMSGPLSGMWCYRLVGYKLLVDIQGSVVTLFAVTKDIRLLPYG